MKHKINIPLEEHNKIYLSLHIAKHEKGNLSLSGKYILISYEKTDYRIDLESVLDSIAELHKVTGKDNK